MSTTYLHSKLTYFFSRNEVIDLELGACLPHSTAQCLDIFERTGNSPKILLLQSGLCLLGRILQLNYKLVRVQSNQGTSVQSEFQAKEQEVSRLAQNEGLRIVVFALNCYLDRLAAAGHRASIEDEMIIKTLMNLVYTVLFHSTEKALASQGKGMKMSQIKQSLEQLQLDSLLIRMVTLTLEVHYLPIKKLVILYVRLLAVLFYNSEQQNWLYGDQQMVLLSRNNRLPEKFLKDYCETNKPEQVRSQGKSKPVENFYARNNVGDCPLAQSIVVGLLRSLLTICNSQAHKKFQRNPAKGSGADSYRQWQVSYQFVHTTEGQRNYRKMLSARSAQMLEQYLQFNQMADGQSQKSNLGLFSGTYFEFYRHKIYATAAISTFFSFLLVSFSKNVKIQFTYLYQLISDANGILVFLKFLTDKFESLSPPSQVEEDLKQKYQSIGSESAGPRFKDEVMLTVYSVLLVLFGACNNYAEKTRSYLFEYNSYLIIKKIPHIFMRAHKNDDQLPSEQEIQAQFGPKAPQKAVGSHWPGKVQELTELCYALLKIQIPFFSKKMKENANNMKMIVEIYCQMPSRNPQPQPRTQLQKLMLKNNIRKHAPEKYILSVEELKGIHNEYNNLYYWSNDQAKISEANQQAAEKNQAPLSMTKQAVQQWLENNLWKFYD